MTDDGVRTARGLRVYFWIVVADLVLMYGFERVSRFFEPRDLSVYEVVALLHAAVYVASTFALAGGLVAIAVGVGGRARAALLGSAVITLLSSMTVIIEWLLMKILTSYPPAAWIAFVQSPGFVWTKLALFTLAWLSAACATLVVPARFGATPPWALFGLVCFADAVTLAFSTSLSLQFLEGRNADRSAPEEQAAYDSSIVANILFLLMLWVVRRRVMWTAEESTRSRNPS